MEAGTMRKYLVTFFGRYYYCYAYTYIHFHSQQLSCRGGGTLTSPAYWGCYGLDCHSNQAARAEH